MNLKFFVFVLLIFIVTKSISTKKKKTYLDYNENFNSTAYIEKKYKEENENDKPEEFYKNIDKVGNESEKSKNRDKEKTETVNSQSNNEIPKENKSIQKKKEKDLWEEKINAFSPHDLLTVLISRGDYDTFYEEIQSIPATITVAFYVHDNEGKIDFEIFSPTNKQIYKIKGKNRGFYEFEANILGVYEFNLDNGRVSLSLC